MRILFFVCFFLGIFHYSFGQNTSILQFRLDTPPSAHYTVEKVQFYIGQLQLLHQNKVIYSCPTPHFLIDLFSTSSSEISLDIPAQIEYDQIQFNLGVDSLTNVSGAGKGCLDATKGMYWAWHSGYINLKIEGTSPKCNTRKHAFKYHIGGYQTPYPTLQTCTFSANPSAPTKLYFQLDRFLQQMDWASEPRVMTPGKRSKELAEWSAQCLTSDP